MVRLGLLGFGLILAGCSSGPGPVLTAPQPMIATTISSPPPSASPAPTPVVQETGSDAVIGSPASRLTRLFGPARIDLTEGDARKLQFANEQCVLDVFLYPTGPGEAPIASYVETRRPQDGSAIDREACVDALRR